MIVLAIMEVALTVVGMLTVVSITFFNRVNDGFIGVAAAAVAAVMAAAAAHTVVAARMAVEAPTVVEAPMEAPRVEVSAVVLAVVVVVAALALAWATWTGTAFCHLCPSSARTSTSSILKRAV